MIRGVMWVSSVSFTLRRADWLVDRDWIAVSTLLFLDFSRTPDDLPLINAHSKR